jgi:hypothetical protein
MPREAIRSQLAGRAEGLSLLLDMAGRSTGPHRLKLLLDVISQVELDWYMVTGRSILHDPDAFLEALADRVTSLNSSATLLDDLGRGNEAARARVEAFELAHLLDLLRSFGASQPSDSGRCYRRGGETH